MAINPNDVAGRHILIVDDDAANRLVVEKLLRRYGYTTVSVADGAQAVAAVDASHFDLVLMDLQMPVMDGLDATRAIRALRGARGTVPIVGFTGDGRPENSLRCREAGMDDLLIKPADPGLLARTVAAWTTQRRQNRRSD